MNNKAQQLQHCLAQAQLHLDQQQIFQARAYYHQALSLFNEASVPHAQLALSYAQTKQPEEALPHALQWTLLDPANPHAYWVYAVLSLMTGRTDQAIKAAMEVLKKAPQWEGLQLLLAKAYLEKRQMSLATPYFEAALIETQKAPFTHQQVRWEYAMQLLTLSDYQRGWEMYESRLEALGCDGLNLCPLPASAWQGESLAGKTIVVHGEQGIGDEIMFSTIVPDLLAQKPKHLILAVFPALVSVMQASFPEATVIAHPRGKQHVHQWLNGVMPNWWYELTQNTQVDFQIPMGSLPHLLRNKRSDYPKKPYIHIQPDHRSQLEQLLKQQASIQNISLEGKRLIGLAWCGNLDNPHGRAKNITLDILYPLKETISQKNVVFVSLQNTQYGHLALEQDQLPIVDMSAHVDAFADTAALASLCEQIISVDTSYLHICGAAGLPVWLLLREKCDWRNGWARSDYDWYGSVELIRQETDGDWTPVLNVLKQKLQAL